LRGVPRFRADLAQISPYRPGRPIIEVAAEYGFDPKEIVKLASNESPLPPMAGARQAILERIADVNRYPDNDSRLLRDRLATHLGVGADEVWVGAGSSELLRVTANTVGGPGTSAVYAWPSFVVYRLATRLAHTEAIEVPLTDDGVHDLDAIAAAIRPDTSLVYLCNPNNPTGTLVDQRRLERFLDEVPEDVLVLVDEAYHEYVTDPGYRSMLPQAPARPNLIVTRTFSKIYALASLRVGYAVARASTIEQLRKAQAPFSVNDLGQAAAIASLDSPDELVERVALNAAGRERLEARLATLGVRYVASQANFVYLRLGAPTEVVAEAFVRHGVIVRPFPAGWVRVSVGSPAENQRFADALDAEIVALSVG
jgi:histidinol-phosphate aminotransferase